MDNEKSFWETYKQRIYDWSVALFLGLGIWWFTRETVEPIYYTWPTERIARKDSPHLSIKWDNEAIDTLCVARVAFWNNGKSPLSQNKLPSSDPLRIVTSAPVRILSVEIANISRPSLPIHYSVTSENILIGSKRSLDSDSILLSIGGSDALESADGFVLRILFTGACQPAFVIDGHIIGAHSVENFHRPGRKVLFDLAAFALGSFLTLQTYSLWVKKRTIRFSYIDGPMFYLCLVPFYTIIVIVVEKYLNASPSWLPPI